MRFTQIPESTFNELQVNAGVIAKDFDPTTGGLDNADIISATSGGITINAKNTFEDFGSDIDNCKKNTKELKRKTEMEVTVSATLLNISKESLKFMLGAADEDATSGAIVARTDLALTDFQTLWFIGDMSNGGYVAIKLIDALSTDGFSLKTNDKGKGNLSVTITAHASLEEQDKEPVEFYIGDPENQTPFITLNKNAISLDADGDYTLKATTYPANATVTWDSTDDEVATVTSGGKVEAVAAGVCVITATITEDGETYIDSCNVTVKATGEG